MTVHNSRKFGRADIIHDSPRPAGEDLPVADRNSPAVTGSARLADSNRSPVARQWSRMYPLRTKEKAAMSNLVTNW